MLLQRLWLSSACSLHPQILLDRLLNRQRRASLTRSSATSRPVRQLIFLKWLQVRDGSLVSFCHRSPLFVRAWFLLRWYREVGMHLVGTADRGYGLEEERRLPQERRFCSPPVLTAGGKRDPVRLPGSRPAATARPLWIAVALGSCAILAARYADARAGNGRETGAVSRARSLHWCAPGGPAPRRQRVPRPP